ncbi:hypothetical protein P1T47_06545 [Streptococcus parauberis]|nr:hypothetical protein P1T47_06545 [Streptococcus parauberis]
MIKVISEGEKLMTKESVGMIIAIKEKAMTQLALSSLLGVTDKAFQNGEKISLCQIQILFLNWMKF